MQGRHDLPPDPERPETTPSANDAIAQPAARVVASTSEACCDRCGSVRLIRVKACWRCEACGYKSDCNGW
jgi:hypothetical protein